MIPVSGAANMVRSLAGLASADGLTALSWAVLLTQVVLFTFVFVAMSHWREDQKHIPAADRIKWEIAAKRALRGSNRETAS